MRFDNDIYNNFASHNEVLSGILTISVTTISVGVYLVAIALLQCDRGGQIIEAMKKNKKMQQKVTNTLLLFTLLSFLLYCIPSFVLSANIAGHINGKLIPPD